LGCRPRLLPTGLWRAAGGVDFWRDPEGRTDRSYYRRKKKKKKRRRRRVYTSKPGVECSMSGRERALHGRHARNVWFL
jgi:hypothetical protein